MPTKLGGCWTCTHWHGETTDEWRSDKVVCPESLSKISMTATTSSVLILVAQVGIAAILFFARHKLQRWATKSVEHRYDSQLEKLKGDLKKNEEEFKAELTRRDKQIDALRSPGLQILAAKRIAIAQRQLTAIDQLWDAVGKQSQLKFACRLLQTVNLERVCEQRILDPNAKAFFGQLFEMAGLQNLQPSDHHAARPYVTEKCWATFSAYHSIGGYAAAWLALLKSGLADRKMIREDEVVALAKAALPSYKKFIDENGAQSVFYLMEVLETAVMKDLRDILDGNPALASVEDSGEVLMLANKLDAEVKAASARRSAQEQQ